MTMREARRQMPEPSGRVPLADGEASSVQAPATKRHARDMKRETQGQRC